jgi:surface antigen
MAALNGQSNNYPEGQCTVYADERYHTLTGYYVPWSGNAQDWASLAIASGWTVSSRPIVPSIICLQGGIQGADSTYGHVGVVESIQGNTVTTSDLNWGPNYSQVSTVNFVVGPGVSFIYATGTNGRPLGQSSSTLSDLVSNFIGNGSGSSTISLSPTADVTSLLQTFDQVLDLQNPFNVNATTDNIAGATFTDPISWIEGFGLNMIDDLVALTLRSIFMIIGVVVIIKVLSNFIDFGAIGSATENGIKTLAMGAALA